MDTSSVTCTRIEGYGALALPASSTRTINADIQLDFAGTRNITVASETTLNINGDLLGPNPGTTQMIEIETCGTLNVVGDMSGYCVLNSGGTGTITGDITNTTGDNDIYEQSTSSSRLVFTGDLSIDDEGHPLRIFGGIATVTGNATVTGGDAGWTENDGALTWNGNITVNEAFGHIATGLIPAAGSITLNGDLTIVNGAPVGDGAGTFVHNGRISIDEGETWYGKRFIAQETTVGTALLMV